MDILYAAYRTLREAADCPGIYDADNDIYFERYLLGHYYFALAKELKSNRFELPKDEIEKLDLLSRVKEAILARIGEIHPIGAWALARTAGEALVARLDGLIADSTQSRNEECQFNLSDLAPGERLRPA